MRHPAESRSRMTSADEAAVRAAVVPGNSRWRSSRTRIRSHRAVRGPAASASARRSSSPAPGYRRSRDGAIVMTCTRTAVKRLTSAAPIACRRIVGGAPTSAMGSGAGGSRRSLRCPRTETRAEIAATANHMTVGPGTSEPPVVAMTSNTPMLPLTPAATAPPTAWDRSDERRARWRACSRCCRVASRRCSRASTRPDRCDPRPVAARKESTRSRPWATRCSTSAAISAGSRGALDTPLRYDA